MAGPSPLAALRRPGGATRAWLGLVLALAIALKLLVPQGWMPGATGLIICPDASPVAMAPAHHNHHDAPGKPAPHQPCAFAGLGLAAAPPTAIPELSPPAAVPPVALSGPRPVAVGRGLAAPPPPSTGPPFLA